MSRARFAGAGLMLLACTTTTTSASSSAVVEKWLTCEECVNGELAAVRALGNAALPILDAALRGPSTTAMASMRESGGRAFARERRYWLTLPAAEQASHPLGDSSAFVQRNADSYRSLYELRAAQALRVINPATARTMITRALLENDAAQVKFMRADARIILDSLSRAP